MKPARQIRIEKSRSYREEVRCCRRCKVCIMDSEPMSRRGEWLHPRGGTCRNAGLPLKRSELVQRLTKAERRARRRGARSR